jgi:hypothetical protein
MSDAGREDLVVHVEGTFDPMAASALHARLRDKGSTGPIVLDFSRAREVYDLALALVVHGLVSDGIRARFRGMSAHHSRMLRYLGLDDVIPAADSI